MNYKKKFERNKNMQKIKFGEGVGKFQQFHIYYFRFDIHRNHRLFEEKKFRAARKTVLLLL